MPREVIDRLQHAMNGRDLEAMLECFAPDYRSEQPAHPDRAFGGRDQVRENWGTLFSGVPDFQADLIRCTVDGDEAWTEWRMHGNRTDGTSLDMRGMAVFGVEAELITWGRLYLELVEEGGEGIEASVRREAGAGPASSA